jgi:hypothetical protein
MSEFERPDRYRREPTVEDVRQLMGASTPHFALHLRNRIHNLIARLNELALGSERRGPIQKHEEGLPSYRGQE